jgi:hypothetical protein
MGHKFTLILNREISEDETGALKASGCQDASITSVPVPGDVDATVTQMDFDTEAKASLAEAIEAALSAVNEIPDLSVPTLDVPAQPPTAAPSEGQDEDGTTDPNVIVGELEGSKPLKRSRAAATRSRSAGR